MIARKKQRLIIIISIVLIVLSIIGVLIALYLTTDMFKSKNSLFAKYFLQNVGNIEQIVKSQPTQIQDAIQNQKLETDLKAKLTYTDSENNNSNTVNQAEIDISSQIDNQSNYDYKNMRLTYENENLAQAEYVKDNGLYGIKLEGIKQFVSGQDENLDELELKTGVSKSNLELLTYIFDPIKLSDYISFTPSELEVLSSTYLSIIQQKATNNKYSKSNQSIKVNGIDYKTNAYSIKLTEEELNDLIITILEKIEKDQILLGKIDILQEQLQKYYLYNPKDDETLKDTIIQLIDDKIQYIKNHNIGQEETEITVYEYKGQTLRTSMKTPKETINLDVDKDKYIQISYIQNLDNSIIEDDFTITKEITETSQNLFVQYKQLNDDEEKQNLSFNLVQNMEGNEISNIYKLQYDIDGNSAIIDINQYINIVEQFDNKVELAQENSINLNNLEQEQAQRVVEIMTNNTNEKIKNIINHVTLEDLNTMLKNLKILKDSEIKFTEDEPTDETVTEVERNRFNSQLTFFIGKEVDKNTLEQLLEAAKPSLQDAQITYEDADNPQKKRIRSIIMNVKRNTTNDEKANEISTAISQESGNKNYTVAMSFNETTRLINQITIVSNEFTKNQ